MADTKDFLVKLSPELGTQFQTFCKVEGRSQQSVFSQVIGNFINGGGDPAGSKIVGGLLEELIFQGPEAQQDLLDSFQLERLRKKLSDMEARMKMK